MDYIEAIAAWRPENEQEAADQLLMLDFARRYPDALERSNPLGHFTSSGFIVNPGATKVLLAHHNQRGVWAWSGGHADGDGDLPAVALREAEEETGASGFAFLGRGIASLDVLTVEGHMKNGRWVSAHLHLSVAYLLVCGEDAALRPRPGENTAVRWFPAEWLTGENLSPGDVYLYNKLLRRARARMA